MLLAKGKLGNVVVYQLGDQYVMRSRPAKVRKTRNMKTCSSNFGMAAMAGKYCRQGLLPVLPAAKDKSMQCRLSGAINSWLGKCSLAQVTAADNIAELQGFNFNESSSFYERFKKRMLFSISPIELKITVPSFDPVTDIAAPAHSESIALNICIAATALGSSSLAGSRHYHHQFSYQAVQAEQIINFDIPAGEHMLIVVAASLSYYLASGKKEQRNAFMPASVLRAVYTG